MASAPPLRIGRARQQASLITCPRWHWRTSRLTRCALPTHAVICSTSGVSSWMHGRITVGKRARLCFGRNSGPTLPYLNLSRRRLRAKVEGRTMPRRGSRAQLLRDIYKWEARILSGSRDEQVDPEDLVGSYDHLSTKELREFVKREEITPARSGAPSKLARGTRNLVGD